MIAALALGMLLSAQAAPVAPTGSAQTPTPASATSSDNPVADLDQLRQMYRDTCEAREYGAYDDMCDQLRQQVRDAERRAARAARRPKAAPAPPAPPR